MKKKISKVLVAVAALGVVGGITGAGIASGGFQGNNVTTQVKAASTLLVGGSFVGSFPNSEAWTGSDVDYYSGNGYKFDLNNETLKSPVIAAGNTVVDIKIQAGYNGSTGSTLTIEAFDSGDISLDSEVYTPNEAYTSQKTYNYYTLTSTGNDISYLKISYAKNSSNLGMKWFSVSTHDTLPSVDLSLSTLSLVTGGATSTVSISKTSNLTAPLTYAWTTVSGTSATIPSASTTDSVIVTSTSTTGDTVIRCTVTDSASLTASADCTITVSAPKTVDALLEGWTTKEDVYVCGYVVSEDINTGNAYQFHFASETVGAVYSASTSGGNCVDLFDYSGSVSLGDYVVISGTTTEYGGLREIGNGYSVLSKSHTAALLNTFIMGSEVDNQCSSKFAAAKAHFLAMSTDEQNLFKDTASYDAAQARYEAWALNQGQKPYEAGAQSANFINFSDSNQGLIILVSFLSLGVIAGATAFFTIRKKRKA